MSSPQPGPGGAPIRPPIPPALALGVAVVAFSWAGPLVRFTGAPALAVSFWRLTLALAAIGLILTLRRDGWHPLRRLGARDLGLALGAGVLLALHFWSWIASIQYTSVASSVVLVSTQPLFVALLSVFLLRETPVPREWVGMGVAVLGAAWIGWGDFRVGGMALFGDALALGAALLAAAYYIVGRSLRARIDLWSYVFVVYGAAALALLPVIVLLPAVPLFEGYGRGDWLVFGALALGPMLLGHTGVNYALRYVRAYLANLAVLGEPVGATLIAWLLPAIAERPSGTTLMGGGLILLGVAVALARPRRAARQEGAPGSATGG